MSSTASPQPRRLAPRLTTAELRIFSGSSGQETADVALGLDGDPKLLENYVFLDSVLPERAAGAVERLAKTESGWALNEKWFLSKHDVVWARQIFGEPQPAKQIAELVALLDIGKQLIEQRYNAIVGTRFEIKATKMLTGQAVGVHNDSPDGARGRTEGYRLLFYPNREYADSDGGHLFFYASDKGPVIGGVRPVFNSGVLMRLSDFSYHAVSRVNDGVRYTVAFLYWGYPVLFDDYSDRELVSRCLRKLIADGFENVRHKSTTLAYHVYHTYRLLFEWGAPLQVCLAGLMGSTLRAELRPGKSIGTGQDEIDALVDNYTLQLIKGLNGDKSVDDERFDEDIKLVRLAAMLEQAEEEEDINRACRFMEGIGKVDGEVRRRIDAEVCRLRADVACARIDS